MSYLCYYNERKHEWRVLLRLFPDEWQQCFLKKKFNNVWRRNVCCWFKSVWSTNAKLENFSSLYVLFSPIQGKLFYIGKADEVRKISRGRDQSGPAIRFGELLDQMYKRKLFNSYRLMYRCFQRCKPSTVFFMPFIRTRKEYILQLELASIRLVAAPWQKSGSREK